MKSLVLSVFIALTFISFSQNTTEKKAIEETLNNYIDGFYKGDTSKLKAALSPRLYKFGYLKNKETNTYEYYQSMNFDQAIAFVQKMKDDGNTRDENKIRNVNVLDIGNHIASAKITALWGIDYMTLSKDGGKWKIEQVLWEGPYEKQAAQTTTTYYLIRHAEKDRSDKTNRNPILTAKGLQRAQKWANTFKDVKFDAVYSTDYNRTKETASPTAKANNLELEFYNPNNLEIEDFIAKTKGKTVLIVGHSNTIPEFTNRLLGNKKHSDIADDNNANLYIVTQTGNMQSSAVLVVD
jgi:broad specificity phosphatase PhoE